MIRGVFVFYFLFSILTAHAETTPSVSQTDYDLMLSAYDSCTQSPYSGRYNCDCAAVLLMEAVQTERERLKNIGFEEDHISTRLYADMDSLRSKSYKSCINRDNVAVDSYGQCLEWALKTRDDYREFCGCYALHYADTAEQEGNDYFADPASTMARAMVDCNRQLHH